MLILARRLNESILIGDEIVVSVVDIKGDQVKLGISAPQNVKVYRREVFEAIQAENRAAALAGTDLPVLSKLVREGKADKRQDPAAASKPSDSAESPATRPRSRGRPNE